MTEALLAAAVRTPIGRYGGSLATVRPDDLAALVVREAVARCGLPVEAVDEVVLGCANQAGEDNRNVARMAALLAGFPDSVPGFTVNRLCASGLTSVAVASQMVACGAADVVVAGGVESMTRAPWVLAKPATPFAKPGEIADSSLGWRFVNERMRELDGGLATLSMGETAEEVARLDGITRQECDEFALESHQRAVAATKDGVFEAELLAVATPSGLVEADEGPRPDTSLARLARLQPAFRAGGIVTAGNSSSLNDGAAAVVVVSPAAAERWSIEPRGRIVGSAAAGVPPHLMGLGPVPATEKVLARAGWSVGDLDVVELNEAFAAQAIACERRLGLDHSRVNAAGGAIALGHPLGCSGARLVVTLLGRLEREGGRRGLATMCVGVGQGAALLLER
ncbi:MAG: thiolase family protein [Acidimicrobiales bacterium]|jgi:3-oxoadipyl-CoA thiolase